jgi:hypothetical protein
MAPDHHSELYYPAYDGLTSSLQCTATDVTSDEQYPLFSLHSHNGLVSHHTTAGRPVTAYIPVGTFPRDTWDPFQAVWQILLFDPSASRKHRRGNFHSLAQDKARKGYLQHDPRLFPHAIRSAPQSANETYPSMPMCHT